MNTDFHTSAESFIFDLKQSIDDVWRNYGNDAALDSLMYAAREYGVMQRAELNEIVKMLDRLKRHVDGLSHDCRDNPLEFGNS